MTRPVFKIMACLMILAVMGGCDKLANTSQATQEVVKRGFNDTKSSWADFLTYHPALPAPLPQTRYCYQMQSDVVCYDSEQSQVTSKLVGYQDGDNISWVQPGGGSLGASGGGAVALRPMPSKSNTHVVPRPQNLWGLIDTGPVETSAVTPATVIPSTTGQISVSKLPPLSAK